MPRILNKSAEEPSATTSSRWVPAFPTLEDFTSEERAERRLRFVWGTLGAPLKMVAEIEGTTPAAVRAALLRLDARAWTEPVFDLEAYSLLCDILPAIDEDGDIDDYPDSDSALVRYFGHLRRHVREGLLRLKRARGLDLAGVDAFLVDWDNAR